MTIRINQSTANAQKRGLRPAGRNSSRMPSGVSAATTVSRTSLAYVDKLRGASRPNDNRIGHLVVQTLSCLAKNEQDFDEAVERNDADDRVDDVAQPEDAAERHGGPVAANHLDAGEFLADCLPVAQHEPDRQP